MREEHPLLQMAAWTAACDALDELVRPDRPLVLWLIDTCTMSYRSRARRRGGCARYLYDKQIGAGMFGNLLRVDRDAGAGNPV